MDTIDSSLLFKTADCSKALWFYGENFDFLDYDRSVECVDSLIRTKAIEWFKSTRNLHNISQTTLKYGSVESKISFVSETDGKFILEKLLFVGSPRARDKEALALEMWLLAQNGILIDQVLIYLPKREILYDENLSFDDIFYAIDATLSTISRQKKIQNAIEALSLPADPNAKINIGCFSPTKCGFSHLCFASLPKNSVLNIGRLKKERRFELLDQGIITTDQIPTNIRFSKHQEIQLASERTNKPHIMHSEIARFLDKLEFPLYFLDFETIQHSIAPFEGLVAYEPLPFQYSLHILHSDGTLIHHDFLATAHEDARAQIAQKLAKEIGDHGSILAYGAEYERRILKRIGDWVSRFADEFANFADRTVDLMTVFEKRWYYHPDMQGSHSLKSVAPIFDSTLDYKTLEIGTGFDALRNYMNLDDFAPQKQEEIVENLLIYGHQDSFSLVQIYKKLKELIGEYSK